MRKPLGRFWASLAVVAMLIGGMPRGSAAQAPVLTQHNDNLRSGLNANETILNTTNVNYENFGKLFAVLVQGSVMAQPLYVPAVQFPGGVTHNVLVVATETDEIYAFDADGVTRTPLWTANLTDTLHGGSSGEAAIATPKNITCTNITPSIGITATPVIDTTTQPTATIFVETWSISGSTYIHRLHALDITTGLEKANAPVVITGSVSGTGDGSQNGQLAFNPEQELSRPGLLLLNGVVYVAYSSMCDYSPYHGWVMAYDENTLAQKSIFATTPNAGLGGIWMSGAGLAADANGSIYVPTGNGYFDTSGTVTDFGDTLLKMATTDAHGNNGILSVTDYFTPFDQATLSANDRDLASGGAMLLPDQPGNYPHQAIMAGKYGRIYEVNRDQLTSNPANPGQAEHYCTTCTATDNQILQETANDYVTDIFGEPAYWNENIYYWGASSTLTSIPITNGLANFAQASSGALSSGFPGPEPAVSSNGNTAGTAIVWAITPSGVYAYDAGNLANMIWNSTQAPNDRDQAGAYMKYSVPTITNGKVYVGAGSEVDVYGLLPSVTPATASLREGQTQQFTTPLAGAVWSISPAVGAISASGLYTAPGTITTSVNVTVTASTLGETATATVVLLPTVTGGGTAATFVDFDTTTQGNWMGVYGAGGYSLAAATQSLPGYDLGFTMANQASWTWASPTTDSRALQTNSTGGRIAAAWYGVSSFSFDVNFTDGQAHQIAFYVLDWDGHGRTETVQIFDASATQLGLLEQRTVSSFQNGTYLVFNVTGHVTVTFTCNNGPNAPLSGVFFGAGGGSNSPAGTATFAGSDTTTQGAWQAKYGADGYFAAPANQSEPSYAFFGLAGQSSWTWATGTTDPRALQFASGSVAAAWYSTKTFSMNVDFSDGNTHQVALYALDWDNQGRSETIQVLDGGTGAVLDSRTASNFANGTWLVWTIGGSVQIVVTQTGGPNAAVSGIFFGGGASGGGGPTNAALSITSTHSGSFTQGQQSAVYTVTVSNTAGAAATSGAVTVNETLPSGLTLAGMSGSGWTCATASTSCTRGDALSAGTSYPAIMVAVNVASNASSPQVNQVSVSGGGSASANASDSTTVSAASGGGGGSATAAYVDTDTTTSGAWQGVYGSDGYALANVATQFLPAYAAFAVQGEINYTWSGSTSDPRALENPAGGGGIAAAWYNPKTFSMNVNITDGNTHQVELYAVDWDHQGRAETVQVFDAASNNLLDTRTLASFSSGAWLVWNISGSVKIVVMETSGPNAVISGIFFGSSNTSGGTETVSVTPGSATLTAGGRQPFSATVTNAATQNVTWAVTSVTPTGAAAGDFSTTTPGLYLAPGAVTITETVTITATSQDGTASGTATVTLNPTTSGGTGASFIGTDSNTEGSWKGVYGAEGYVLANVTAQQQPSYGAFAAQSEINYTWAPTTSDPRALELPTASGSIAAAWYNPTTFTMTVNITDGNSHQVAIYAVDWDHQGRSEKVQITNAATNATLDTRTLANFGNGAYLVWSITGSVKITVTQVSGPNTVVSGVFFGTGTAAPTLQAIQVTPGTPSIALGNTQQFTATGTYSDGSTQNLSNTVSWSTVPAGIATVSSSGLATSTATGQTTVRATSGNVVGTATLTVTPATLVSMEVTPANPSIQQGTEQQFTAMGTYTDGTMQNLTASVTWSTSDSSIASISTSGMAMGVNTGMVTIGAALQAVQGGTMLTVTSSGGGN